MSARETEGVPLGLADALIVTGVLAVTVVVAMENPTLADPVPTTTEAGTDTTVLELKR